MCDVLVAGGGPAGLAAAIALGLRGARVTLADPAAGLSDTRGELLPQGAEAILRRLGLGEVIARSVAVSEVASRWGQARLQAHEGLPGLGLHGWGVDRRMLSRIMLERARACGVGILAARVGSAARQDGLWHVGLRGTENADGIDGATGASEHCARYLVDATGRAAAIARRQGATLLQDTDLVALTWFADGEVPARMLCEAAPDGWWYQVPCAGGSTLGFVTSAARAREIGDAPEQVLKTAGAGLGLIEPRMGGQLVTRRLDCRSALLDRLCGPGWLAVGDAAAAFDPISSQGLFNALSAGFFAGNAAADCLAGDEDAPLVLEALMRRTAERTHMSTHLQYAARPFDTTFWRNRAGRMPAGPAVAV